MADIEDRRPSAEELLEQINEAKRKVSDEGRPEDTQKMHDRGTLTARERVDYLCDEGTFDEIGQLAAPAPATPETADWDREDAPADGVVTGIGSIEGEAAGVISFDFTVKGGSIGHTGFYKVRRIMEQCMRNGFPLVWLHEGGGHRIQEGLDAKTIAHGDYSGLFTLLAKLSGWVPLIHAIVGPGFAGPTNYSGLCDFVPILEKHGTMGIAGPPIMEAALGKDFEISEFGADFHTRETGMADLSCEDDETLLDDIKDYLSYLPQNANAELPIRDDYEDPPEEKKEDLLGVVPPNPRKSYDTHDVIEGIFDRDSFFEMKPNFGKNMVTGFARIEGHPMGIIGNNPQYNAGIIDANACNKAPRFIGFCDAMNLPMLFLVDIAGFLPGKGQERAGIARHSGKFFYELGRATVPVYSVVMRRGYGAGYCAMAGGRVENELTLVWPTTEIAGMSIEGATSLVWKKEIEEADDPEAKHKELIDRFTNRTGPLRATEDFGVDDAIDPRLTRDILARSLKRSARTSNSNDMPPKKHGVTPI